MGSLRHMSMCWKPKSKSLEIEATIVCDEQSKQARRHGLSSAASGQLYGDTSIVVAVSFPPSPRSHMERSYCVDDPLSFDFVLKLHLQLARASTL